MSVDMPFFAVVILSAVSALCLYVFFTAGEK